MRSPTASDFAALARSSPWRWSTLRFTARWPHDPWRTQELRAWLRRPDRLRVETMNGELMQIVHELPRQANIILSGIDLDSVTLPWWTDAGVERPVLGADGLVAHRPDGFSSRITYDAPMYRDYFWVAMLDPVELADGSSPDTGALLPGTEIDGVTEVEHNGRQAWEALLRPTPAYAPRCTCCSLLRFRVVDVAEAASGAGDKVVLAEYPEAYRVRLDVSTAVCVLTEPIGGSVPGSGHEVRIETVDESMGDELFDTMSQAEHEP